jgi:hypothetical protein
VDWDPNHAILRPGTTVQIGLDKNTKLSAVFARYVLFCNTANAAAAAEADHAVKGSRTADISVDDLEFVHCHLLKSHETAEAAALMKNDRITVRKEQVSDRDIAQELLRAQRESDKEYFEQMRQLVPGGSLPLKVCDTVLDCQGTVADDLGRIQQVLSTHVRCPSAVVRKRCPWLGRMIDAASQERERRSIVSLPDAETAALAAAYEREEAVAVAERHLPVAESKDSEDDDIEVLNYNAAAGLAGNIENGAESGAAQIENDEEDTKANTVAALEDAAVGGASGGDEDSFSTVRSDSNLLWVTLPNHSPDAVKLMLEFVYTNRVIPLGLMAFLQSCKNKPGRKHQGPVAPFVIGSAAVRHWPNRGEPTVNFAVAMTTLGLAEEASLPRLSLMCEIAAAQLVSVSNVVDALAYCQTQNESTGNSLPRLRKAAMEIVLRSGPRGVFVLPTFRRALEERGKALIPTLLMGTMEAVDKADTKTKRGHLADKRNWQEIAMDHFGIIDREDNSKRDRERRKRRIERWDGDPAHAGEQYDEDRAMDTLKGTWTTTTSRRGIKRGSEQMDEGHPPLLPQQHRHSSNSHRRGSRHK